MTSSCFTDTSDPPLTVGFNWKTINDNIELVPIWRPCWLVADLIKGHSEEEHYKELSHKSPLVLFSSRYNETSGGVFQHRCTTSGSWVRRCSTGSIGFERNNSVTKLTDLIGRRLLAWCTLWRTALIDWLFQLYSCCTECVPLRPWAACSNICLYQYVTSDKPPSPVCQIPLGLLHLANKTQIWDTWPRCRWRLSLYNEAFVWVHTLQKNEKVCVTGLSDVKMICSLPRCTQRRGVLWSGCVCVSVCATVCVWSAVVWSDLFLGVFVWLLMPWQDR